MGQLYIILINNGIMQCGINAYMTEQSLHLFDWHTFIDGHCCKRTTKFMRMDLRHRKGLPKFPDTHFYTTDS